jgi:hypothetical protein
VAGDVERRPARNALLAKIVKQELAEKENFPSVRSGVFRR